MDTQVRLLFLVLIVLATAHGQRPKSWTRPTSTRPRPTSTKPHPTSTRPTPTGPLYPGGCFHDDVQYPNHAEIRSDFDGMNWCSGIICEDGQLLHWDNWNCGSSTPSTGPPPTSVPHSPSTTTAPPSTTTTPPSTTAPRTPMYMKKRTMHRGGCFYNGQLHANNAEISSGFDGNNWCYGLFCTNGQLVAWDNFNCGSTTTTPPSITWSTTTPPSSTAATQTTRQTGPQTAVVAAENYAKQLNKLLNKLFKFKKSL